MCRPHAKSARGGFGVGSVLAIVVSWTQHQSILWAVVHGFLGWFYLVYYWLTQR